MTGKCFDSYIVPFYLSMITSSFSFTLFILATPPSLMPMTASVRNISLAVCVFFIVLLRFNGVSNSMAGLIFKVILGITACWMSAFMSSSRFALMRAAAAFAGAASTGVMSLMSSLKAPLLFA